MVKFKDKTQKEKYRYLIVVLIYAVVFTFAFFLMFLGILRTFEVNNFFGKSEQYAIIKSYCEPRGFFGWGYECDPIQYNKDLGNLPEDYQEFPILEIIDYNFSPVGE